MKLLNLFILVCFSLLITACGGSSGSSGSSSGGGSTSGSVTFSGNTEPATIDEENAEEIGTTAGEAVDRAANSSSVPSPVGVTLDNSQIDLTELNQLILDNVQLALTPSGVTIPNVCSSGSASYTGPTQPPSSGPVTYTFTYNQCTLNGSDVKANGTATIKYNDFGNANAGFEMTYTNFTVTQPGAGTSTINMTIICTNSTTCTYNSDFVGSDGSTHRVSSFSISGNATSGYNGTFTFSHSTYGTVSITATGVTYGVSCGTHPNGGTISFSSTNGSSGTITFASDCTVSGTWNNGSVSGSF